MRTLEVLEVTCVPSSESSPEDHGSSIDEPRAGTETDLHVLRIAGRLLGRAAPAVGVEVVYEREVIRSAPLRRARPELLREIPTTKERPESAFELLVGTLGLTPTFELDLRAVLEGGTRTAIGSIKARHEPLRTAYEPKFQPIILTSLGRMGTTWLMKVFASHPEVVVYPRYPYELSPAKYWTHMIDVLSEPAAPSDPAEPDLEHGPWFIGPNPFLEPESLTRPASGRWLARDYVEKLAAFGQKTIDDWYTAVAGAEGQSRPRYFAEKHMPVRLAEVMREIYPGGKEIFLIRDPRDMAWSVIQFDRARGFAGFGRQSATSEEDYVRTELRDRAAKLHASWVKRRDSSHLVRYEDLVQTPVATLTALLDHLELESSAEIVGRLLDQASAPTREFDAHRTSGSVEGSIGRWQLEADDLALAFEEAFGSLAREFGYN